MDKTKLETTVGFFVLLGLVIFFVIIFFVSGVFFWREGYHVKAEFDYTAGINKGASVRVSGVRVGEVNAVTLDYDNATGEPFAIVDMWIEKGVKIRNDSRAYILGTYALNETLIEIMPNGNSARPFMRDGDVLQGVEPMPMEKVFERGLELVHGFEDLGAKIEEIIGDEEILQATRNSILDMSKLLDYGTQLVDEKEDQFDNVVDNMDETLTRLANILEAIENSEGTLGKLVNDDELYSDVQTFIKELDTETKSLIREIKLHPWRLLKKDKNADEDEDAPKKRKFF